MTQTTTYYIDANNIENLYIVRLTAYKDDFLEKPRYEVYYETTDENSKYKESNQSFYNQESAFELVDIYLDFIKRFNDINKVVKQTVIHEEIKI